MAERIDAWTRIKKTRGRMVEHPTALTRPASLKQKGGQAVSKPMALLYATTDGLAVTSPGEAVVKLTVLVVA